MTTKKPTPKKKAAEKTYATVGSAGGKSTFKRIGKKGMAELGRKGAAKRWGKKSKAKKAA